MTKFLNISTDGTLTGNSDSTVVSEKAIKTYADTKQVKLVSGTNIKTVNGNSLLGSGDITISSGVAWGNITGTLSNQTDLQNALSAKVNSADLATVATSGSYNDLTNKPTIPAAQVNSDWNAVSGVAQILNKPTLATVATSGSYTDLSNKPTIPTVNDATITITQGGVTKGSFTLNQASGDTIDLDAGGGSGYTPNIFDWKWADHELDDMSWLRADTFSWQDGTVYTDAYNHLLNEYNALEETVWGVVVLNVGYWYRNASLDQIGADHPYAFTDEFGENLVYCDATIPLVGESLYNGKTSSATTVGNITSCSYDTIRWLSKDTVGGVTVKYAVANDGHKIVPYYYITDVEAMFAATGVAWYYVLDPVNTQFKLPRTQYGVVGYRNAVGDYVEAGLPNITGNTQICGAYSTSSLGADGAFQATATYTAKDQSGSTNYTRGTINFDASRSSSIYGNSTTVQPPATQMYLYFYVGQFSQSAIEQTAGLNAELFNGKVDIGHQVIAFQEPTAANNYTWYRKYADGWVEQGGITEESAGGTAKNITFPIAMSDTHYLALITLNGSLPYGSAGNNFGVKNNNTTTGMTVYTGNTASAYWQVKGMAA